MKFGEGMRGLLAGAGLWAAVVVQAQDSPKTVSVTEATKLEIVRAGKTTGTVGLEAGTKLDVILVEGEWARVKFRSLEGRVAVAKTDLAQPAGATTAQAATNEASPVAVAKPAPTKVAVTASSPLPEAPAVAAPTSVIGRLLAGKLVRWESAGLRPVAADRLTRVKFYAIYFSAGWCPPCREFTPGFVDAYGKIREIYPEFETVFVSNDKSPAEMFAYMRDDHMAWPAVRWDQIRGLKEINRYAGSGIPCLVLVDAEGKVLSDSFRWGRYVGPDAVLEDAWKILREFRRKNPRVKSS